MPEFGISATVAPQRRVPLCRVECETGREAIIRAMNLYKGRGYSGFVAVDTSWRPGQRGKITYERKVVDRC